MKRIWSLHQYRGTTDDYRKKYRPIPIPMSIQSLKSALIQPRNSSVKNFQLSAYRCLRLTFWQDDKRDTSAGLPPPRLTGEYAVMHTAAVFMSFALSPTGGDLLMVYFSESFRGSFSPVWTPAFSTKALFCVLSSSTHVIHVSLVSGAGKILETTHTTKKCENVQKCANLAEIKQCFEMRICSQNTVDTAENELSKVSEK